MKKFGTYRAILDKKIQPFNLEQTNHSNISM